MDIDAADLDWNDGSGFIESDPSKKKKKDASASSSSSDDDSDSDSASESESHEKEAASAHKASASLVQANAATTPHTADHYEKLLLANPNSSYTWVQYIAYWLGRSLVTNAREVARRALGRIDAREEEEKLNVWIALLNLENSYGDESSLEAVLKEALQYNYPKKVYLAAITMFSKAGNRKKEDRMYKGLLAKYYTHKSVWIKRSPFPHFSLFCHSLASFSEPCVCSIERIQRKPVLC